MRVLSTHRLTLSCQSKRGAQDDLDPEILAQYDLDLNILVMEQVRVDLVNSLFVIVYIGKPMQESFFSPDSSGA